MQGRNSHVRCAFIVTSSLLWAAVTPVAVLGTGRELLAVLAPACLSASAIALRRAGERAAARVAECEAMMAARAAEYERLEGRLCRVVAELHRLGRSAPMTLPGLRVVRPSGGAPARR
jgi:hypothetical protein